MKHITGTYKNAQELAEAYPGRVVLDTAHLGLAGIEDGIDEAFEVGLSAIGRGFDAVLLEGRRVYVLAKDER